MNIEIRKKCQWGLYYLWYLDISISYLGMVWRIVVFFFNLNLCYNKVSYDSSQSNGICNISKGSVWSCQRPLLIINSENLVWRAIKILPLWIIKKGKLLGLVSSLMETLKETASSCKWNAYQLFIILWLLILDKVLFELELGIIWFIKNIFFSFIH